MTIEKAIEVLTLEVTTNLDSGAEDFNAAVKLGIEALKRIQECRPADYMIKEDYLPGETEE